jgi:hypothetical protein
MAQHGHLTNDQAGLEVVPEPEAPQVVEKPYHEQTHNPYAQTPVSQTAYGGYSYPNSGGGYAQSGYPDSSTHWAGDSVADAPVADKSRDKRILGLPRRKFWMIFGPLLAILVIGLAVGLGVGLGTRKSSSR